MSRPMVRASLMTAAVMLVQLAWIFALPPFRGIDEFDHAYRAAAVAHGQWLPRDSAHVRGHGDYVEVPPSLVKAARPVCESYTYTGHDNCNPADRVGKYVEVASGSARYNPIFYWIIGKPASFFAGAANVYVLRIVASLLCAVFVWCAGYALTVGFRTAWPLLGAAVTMTPVLVYSTAVPGPNGVEMVSSLALWSAALALGHATLPRRVERRLLVIAAVAACVLVTTRTLGPLWLFLVLETAVPLLGRARRTELRRTHRWTVRAGATALLVATAGAIAWTKIAAPNSLAHEQDLHLPHPFLNSLVQMPLWVLQSLAAFPMRNDPAPTVVYGTSAAALLLVIGVAAARLRRWQGAVLALIVLVWLVAQLVISTSTFSQLGAVWQGRYALPFVVGVPVLVSAWADRRRPEGPRPALVAVVAGLVVTAHAVSVVHVMLVELRTSPLAGAPAWFTVAPAVLALLVISAGGLFVAAGGSSDRVRWTRRRPAAAAVGDEPGEPAELVEAQSPA